MGILKAFGGLSGYKRVAVLVTAVMLMVMLCTLAVPAAGQTAHNYAEAFQKSIYFYDAEKSGPGITGGRLEWRGDSDLSDMQVPLRPKGADGLGTNMSQAFINANRAVLDPDGNGSMDLSGGMHDAGDHVKFGLPQSYSFSTLGWSYYHFKDAYQGIGENQHMVEVLKWFSDYYLRATFLNSSGDVVAFAYQVGEGSVDHTLWAPPELHNMPRPAYFSTSETPATDQAAAAAAALSIMYLNYRDIDATYATRCLNAAKALYRHAKQYHSDSDPKLGYSGGFYNSSYDHDELSWAAVWLYRATGDQTYITDITAVDSTGHYTGWLKKIIASTQDNWQNIWVHSWDTVWGGVFVELAPITDDPKHWYYARWNLEYWSGVAHEDPSDRTFLAGTDAGFKVISTWGSARYNAAAQLQAMVYRSYTGRTDFTDWAKTQMDYILGDNPFGYSLEVGYPSPELSVKHPHHRAAHGSFTNSMDDPPNHRHVLWGALAGGPDYDDVHKDLTTDFVYNEVAIDYNAGFVGALAGMYKYYGAGQRPVANFPPLEPPETAYFDLGKIEQESNQRTQFSVRLNAIPTKPPRLVTGLKARYFFNISELAAYGQGISAVSAQIMYDEQASSYGGSTKIVGPVAWDAANGIYYVEMDWSANGIVGKRDIQVALVAAMASDFQSHWDPTNDWSHQGLSTTALVSTQNIPIYLNGVRVYGQEPGPNQPTTPPPTTPAVTTPPPTTPPATTPPATTPPVTTPPPGSVSINSGGPATGSFAADQYFSGGSTYTNTRTIDVSQIPANTAPAAVFSTERYGAMTYTIPNRAGTQTVTLYFVETYVTAAGQRVFNVSINGATVLSRFDIFASAGGANRAIARSFSTTANSSGQVVIQFTSVTQNPKISGLTVSGGGTPPVTTPPPTTPPVTTPPPTTPPPTTPPVTTPPPTTPPVTTPPPTTPPVTTPPPTTPPPACSPVTSTITVPFNYDGAGTFCWQTSSLGAYINSWNLARLTINGVDITNRWTGSGSYPPAINGSWYISYQGNFPWSHFEAK